VPAGDAIWIAPGAVAVVAVVIAVEIVQEGRCLERRGVI
jgi:hypothetical protein